MCFVDQSIQENNGCVTTFPPNNLGEAVCDQVWDEARLIIMKLVVGNSIALGTWKNAEQIHVINTNADGTLADTDICYKPQIYKDNGWCKLATDKSAWGICYSSCIYFVRLVFFCVYLQT